ncbi:RNase H domain-containing protein [Hirsutella rhossiliensis]
MPADSSQDVFLEFQALATAHGATEVRWIPGHTSIPGNEQADALAKAGTSQPEPAGAVPTLAYLRRAARQQPIEPRHRMRLTPSPTAAVNRAIGRDFDRFVKLAKASSFFEWACPRH